MKLNWNSFSFIFFLVEGGGGGAGVQDKGKLKN